MGRAGCHLGASTVEPSVTQLFQCFFCFGLLVCVCPKVAPVRFLSAHVAISPSATQALLPLNWFMGQLLGDD
eukprot:4168175-Alexandrium_andersonii.AAC.1